MDASFISGSYTAKRLNLHCYAGFVQGIAQREEQMYRSYQPLLHRLRRVRPHSSDDVRVAENDSEMAMFICADYSSHKDRYKTRSLAIDTHSFLPFIEGFLL